jgi:hypothetical protein
MQNHAAAGRRKGVLDSSIGQLSENYILHWDILSGSFPKKLASNQ